MRKSPLTAAVVLLGCSLLLAACGDDTTPGGDAGSGGSDTSGGGSDAGGTGGTGGGGTSGAGGSTGGDTGDGGGGALEYGSGTITMDFNGTPVTFEVWQARVVGALGLQVSADSTNSDTVDSVSFALVEPSTGSFDCATVNADITVQADNSEGETDIFDGAGSSNCNITVTEYGAPGEPVRGTFSGEVLAAGSMSATIENGTFDLIRGSD